jgi:hypothetical protein
MKKISQLTLNKILISALVVLTLVLGYRALTEQARVDYYICYEQHTSSISNPDEEKIKEYCQEYIKE